MLLMRYNLELLFW